MCFCAEGAGNDLENGKEHDYMLGTGIKGAIEKKVTSEMTARFVGSGELEVLATPVLISLVEEAAWRSVAGQLEEGQGTVGTLMNLKHTAATPIGLTVRCETELIEIDRRRLVFSIKAYDEKEQIADGVCERFIIDNEKFMSKAMGKL